MNVGATADAWLVSKQARRRVSSRTARDQRRYLLRFAEHVGFDRPIAEITATDFESWLCTLEEYQPGTQVTMAAPIRAFFAWCRARGHIADDPCSDVPRPRIPRQDPKALSRSTVDKIIHSPSDRRSVFRDKTLTIVAYWLGLRIGELAAMRIEHWDRDEQTLIVYGKGGTIVSMPCVNEAADALEVWVDFGLLGALSGPMWPSPTRADKNISRGWIGKLVKQTGADAGVEMHAHMLRHSIATHLARDGVHHSIIKEYMRHASDETTGRYTRAVMADVRQAMLAQPGFVEPIGHTQPG